MAVLRCQSGEKAGESLCELISAAAAVAEPAETRNEGAGRGGVVRAVFVLVPVG